MICDPRRIIEVYELGVALLAALFLRQLPRKSPFQIFIVMLVFLLIVTEWNRNVLDFARPTNVYARWVEAPIDIDSSLQIILHQRRVRRIHVAIVEGVRRRGDNAMRKDLIFSSLRVDGDVALVTGTGSGLGRAIAIGLAHSGADLALTELPDRLSAAEETVREIERQGRRARVFPLDVLRLPMIGECVDQVLRHFGRINILVNNAGINIPRLAVDVTEDDWDRVLDVDLKGVFFVSQAVAKTAMIPQRSGKIVNVASMMGLVGYSYRAAYCSAKAGVVNLTRVLAYEWAQYAIRVNAIAPTFVETPLTQPMFKDKAFAEDVLRRIPLGRLAEPEDVVGAVAYLSSAAADMVTGHTLAIDGGWTSV